MPKDWLTPTLGDLRENSEYDAARNDQSVLEGRIAQIERILRYSKIIEGSGSEVVAIGATVTLEDGGGVRTKYTIVSSTEADPLNDLISDESPLGKTLTGKKKDDKVILKTPKRNIEYTIIDIEQ